MDVTNLSEELIDYRLSSVGWASAHAAERIMKKKQRTYLGLRPVFIKHFLRRGNSRKPVSMLGTLPLTVKQSNPKPSREEDDGGGHGNVIYS